MSRRSYSDEERERALAYYEACGGRLRKTSRDVNVALTTLQRWVRDAIATGTVTEQGTRKKRELATWCDDLAAELIDSAPDKIAKAGLKDVAVAIGVLIDKAQLLRGKPTSITDDMSKARNAVEAYKRIKADKGESVTDEQAIAALEPLMPAVSQLVQ